MESYVGNLSMNLYNKGIKLAEERGSNSLEDLAGIFSGGNITNIVKNGVDEVYVKNSACFAKNFANDLAKEEFKCGCDNALAEGFNSSLGCEVIQTIESGCSVCIHRLYIKK
ncbi:hypothetical protein JK636_14970 [Clostridium sp. YIM B02515]|uniref:Uncharacterized protein n=1 Tax=Clostridium rhizosphaerae TaxID=2803861 RepID=A0ABS1TCI8_9CLOT|nr:hypothetical protein [Clostridium rhizosphaerae]MBL4937055.1 hypothetical protein [Clostridium rhizosphaerae]